MPPADARDALLARFADLGIPAAIVAYPAHATVAEVKRLRGDMAGTFTKNLLLRDKTGRLSGWPICWGRRRAG